MQTRWLSIWTVIALTTISIVISHVSKIGALRASDAGPVVNIGAPLPLPTAAAQRGACDVSITGTPNVTVGNSASSPVPTRAVDNPGLHPILFTQSGTQSSFSFLIPNASNMVIEQVMMRCLESSTTFAPTDFELEVSIGNVPASFFFAPATLSLPGSTMELIVNQNTRIYASGGSSIILANGFPAPSGTHCDASLSGHLVAEAF